LHLNIGVGDQKLKGFTNLDLPDFDITQPWTLPEQCADYVLMSHVLEHVTRDKAIDVLYEAKRVLKVGGTLHIAVPDLDKFIDCHLAQDFTPLGGYTLTNLNDLMGGGMAESRPEYRHKYMWSYGSLYYYMHEVAGFRNVRKVEMNEWDTKRFEHISLYVEGVK
jgi:predicted SAM-dependent methyltransferase